MPISAGGRRSSSKRLPAAIRLIVVAIYAAKLRATLHGHGIGLRISPDEILALATRSIDAIADFLGDKPFFMGSELTRRGRHHVSLSRAGCCPRTSRREAAWRP